MHKESVWILKADVFAPRPALPVSNELEQVVNLSDPQFSHFLARNNKMLETCMLRRGRR